MITLEDLLITDIPVDQTPYIDVLKECHRKIITLEKRTELQSQIIHASKQRLNILERNLDQLSRV